MMSAITINSALTRPTMVGTAISHGPSQSRGLRQTPKTAKLAASRSSAVRPHGPSCASTWDSPELVSAFDASGASWVSHQWLVGNRLVSGSQ